MSRTDHSVVDMGEAANSFGISGRGHVRPFADQKAWRVTDQKLLAHHDKIERKKIPKSLKQIAYKASGAKKAKVKGDMRDGYKRDSLARAVAGLQNREAKLPYWNTLQATKVDPTNEKRYIEVEGNEYRAKHARGSANTIVANAKKRKLAH